jgi:hypothetical protein
MALSQMQTIQSLGNNLAILQQEVETFGELYACVITNGQMALNTNEKGYDVVSSTGVGAVRLP